jgi:hypothetical protein
LRLLLELFAKIAMNQNDVHVPTRFYQKAICHRSIWYITYGRVVGAHRVTLFNDVLCPFLSFISRSCICVHYRLAICKQTL